MSDYTWPASWIPDRFEMRVQPNTRVFTSPYGQVTQTLDLLGERWTFSLDMPPATTKREAGAYEAFFDRLLGPVNRIVMWNLAQPQPNGTWRDTDVQTVVVQNSSAATVTVQNSSLATVTVQGGTPMISGPIAQFANTAQLTGMPGKTVYAGDMAGLGGVQTVRVMVDTVFDGNGEATIEFMPRARQAIANGTAVITNKPTINFILRSDGVPVVRRPGFIEGPTLEGVEAI